MRGDGRVFLRGKTYWCAYYVRGEEVRESTKVAVDGTPKAEKRAHKFLKKRLAQVETKTYIGPSEERISFEDLVSSYLSEYKVSGLRSPETAELRVKHLRRHLGLFHALDITPTRLKEYQKTRLAEGASGATVNRELAALRRAFAIAVEDERLSRIPPFPKRIEEATPRQGFLEHADYLAIRSHLREEYADALDFAYHSGWRKREIFRLQWSRVDLDGNVLHLDPKDSKNKQGRTLPIMPPLREVLLRRQAKRAVEVEEKDAKSENSKPTTRRLSPYVFHVAGRPIGDWRKAWASACIAAGFGRPKTDRKGEVVLDKKGNPVMTAAVLLHDCRRTAARNLDRAGVSRSVAMTITGHKTEEIYHRYNIVSTADVVDAGQKWARYIKTLSTRSKVISLKGATATA
jgi:integrase